MSLYKGGRFGFLTDSPCFSLGSYGYRVVILYRAAYDTWKNDGHIILPSVRFVKWCGYERVNPSVRSLHRFILNGTMYVGLNTCQRSPFRTHLPCCKFPSRPAFLLIFSPSFNKVHNNGNACSTIPNRPIQPSSLSHIILKSRATTL